MTKFVIVGFDGLRRDVAASGQMPNLASFVREWSWCAGHRAVFPVETYVNHPSIFSGFFPARHGIIANMYHNRPGASEALYFLGAEVDSVEANDRKAPLLDVPTMGMRLGDEGLAMRVIGSNSAGSTRLKHHKADLYPGHLNMPVRDVGRTIPSAEEAAYRALHGGGYPLEFPDLKGSQAVIDSFFEVELKRGLADVTVLWLGEPDHSSHEDGPDGPRTAAALAQADELFGKVLSWWREKPGDVQILVVSDHGHVVIEALSSVRRTLEDGGLKIVNPFELERGEPLNEADLVMSGGYCAGLWTVREGDLPSLKRAAEILMACPDVGLLFTARPDLGPSPESGLLAERLVLSDHLRAPDLRLVTFGDPATNRIRCESGYPVGGGAHGGLLPGELNALCAWGGNLFKRGRESRLPSGPADVTATVLKLLGFNDGVLSSLDGRVLGECLRDEGPSASEDSRAPAVETFTSRRGDYRQLLQRSIYQSRVYLDRGYREL